MNFALYDSERVNMYFELKSLEYPKSKKQRTYTHSAK